GDLHHTGGTHVQSRILATTLAIYCCTCFRKWRPEARRLNTCGSQWVCVYISQMMRKYTILNIFLLGVLAEACATPVCCRVAPAFCKSRARASFWNLQLFVTFQLLAFLKQPKTTNN
ncbi:hypothetical protein HAX54_014746, partial [Datura stramonium]|nr:hypothetical protein [Datura stramonium]